MGQACTRHGPAQPALPDRGNDGVAYAPRLVAPYHPRAATTSAPPQSALGRLAGRMDGFDWTVLLGLAALSLWVLALVVREQTSDHIWIGAEGTRLADQVQFLGWVRDAGDG